MDGLAITHALWLARKWGLHRETLVQNPFWPSGSTEQPQTRDRTRPQWMSIPTLCITSALKFLHLEWQQHQGSPTLYFFTYSCPHIPPSHLKGNEGPYLWSIVQRNCMAEHGERRDQMGNIITVLMALGMWVLPTLTGTTILTENVWWKIGTPQPVLLLHAMEQQTAWACIRAHLWPPKNDSQLENWRSSWTLLIQTHNVRVSLAGESGHIYPSINNLNVHLLNYFP